MKKPPMHVPPGVKRLVAKMGKQVYNPQYYLKKYNPILDYLSTNPYFLSVANPDRYGKKIVISYLLAKNEGRIAAFFFLGVVSD